MTQDKYKIYAESFELKTRDNGDKFYCHKDNAPKWCIDITHAAHGDMMPDDYKYQFAHGAANALYEAEGDLDAAISSIEPDCYNSDLLKWVASNLSRAEYVNDAFKEFGQGDLDLFAAIGWGQYAEANEVLNIVASELENIDLDNVEAA